MGYTMYRQGDVLLVHVSRQRQLICGPTPSQNRVILAHGEKTGHTHSVPADAAVLETLVVDGIAQDWLYVRRRTELIHEEHEAITLEPGRYRVMRQRVYDPAENLQVSD